MNTAEVIRLFLAERQRRGLLVGAKLAKAMDLKPSMMSMIMRGEREFPMQRIDRAAEFFRMSVIEFITTAEQETQRSAAAEQRATGTAGPTFPMPDRRAVNGGSPSGVPERRRR